MNLLNSVIVGDALTELRRLPAGSADCCVTSPPYFRLRNYQVAGQLGLEGTVDEWVEHVRVICQEVARVLTPTGGLWLNVGDSYSRNVHYGAADKSLLLAPERLLMALLADGWIVRNKVIWAKPNPMPTSVRDRLNTTHEYVYFLTRQPRYFFDLDAIRVPHRSQRSAIQGTAIMPSAPPDWSGPLAGSNDGLNRLKADGRVGHPLGKNPGDVWTIATASGQSGHHATFPERLIEIPIRSTCPRRACQKCGTPWRRSAARSLGHLAVAGELRPGCSCEAGWRPGVVLDPFMGSGTTAAVANRLDRSWIGIELNPGFAAAAKLRASVSGEAAA
jgi:site-specific DNA-methyltransferase (adenine-specific)